MQKDAIIILAGGIKQDGTLPNQARLRIKKGAQLYKNGIAPRIIMSGAYSFLTKHTPPKTEAEAMAEYAILSGVNKKDILLEKESQDTISNAYSTKINFLKPNNWKKIIVVTSNYHKLRTEYIFKKVLGKEYNTKIITARTGFTNKKLRNELKSERKKFNFTKYFFDKFNEFLDFK